MAEQTGKDNQSRQTVELIEVEFIPNPIINELDPYVVIYRKPGESLCYSCTHKTRKEAILHCADKLKDGNLCKIMHDPTEGTINAND